MISDNNGNMFIFTNLIQLYNVNIPTISIKVMRIASKAELAIVFLLRKTKYIIRYIVLQCSIKSRHVDIILVYLKYQKYLKNINKIGEIFTFNFLQKEMLLLSDCINFDRKQRETLKSCFRN